MFIVNGTKKTWRNDEGFVIMDMKSFFLFALRLNRQNANDKKEKQRMKKLGFGLMRLPQLDEDYTHIDVEKVKEMVDAFINAGGTYFDTAYMYHGGYSERVFKEAVVTRYDRDSFTVTDKLPMGMISTATQMEEIFTEQLERCGVTYFDYYWLHALNRSSYETTERLHAFDFIMQKKKEGKIRHIGFSFHDSPEVLEKILSEHPETEYVQLQINYLDWADASVQAKRCYEVAVSHNKPVIVMEPVKGGALVDIPKEAVRLLKEKEPSLSTASWAVRYAATHERVMLVLSGMSSLEQVEDNISYMKEFKPLNEEELALVYRAAQIIRETIAVPCTACRYCIDECPQRIAIPDYFALYNAWKKFGRLDKIRHDYNKLLKEHGAASACIKCGKCEAHCPQKLAVRDFLKQAAEVLE